MKKLAGIALLLYLATLQVLILLLIFLRDDAVPSPLSIPQFPEIQYSPTPDFAGFETIPERKAAFFSYIGEIIDEENRKLLAHRKFLKKIQSQIDASEEVSENIRTLLARYAEKFDVDYEENPESLLNTLLMRVNYVPKALALAQAASESAWGTSRFAFEGNNYFGQWCFDEGCGIVPNRRRQGAIHEVKTFSSAEESVRAYLYNINTHRAYRDLRHTRAKILENGENLSALKLAEGLVSYSERGNAYIEDIKNIITANELEKNYPDLALLEQSNQS